MSEEYEDFLTQWSETPLHAGKSFVRDGVIDPMRWAVASPKVLFLLKEAYGEDGTIESWDLRGLIRDGWHGPKYKIWRLASYWAYAAHHCSGKGVPPLPVTTEEIAAASEALLSSATINIKKSGGHSHSIDDDLAAYVRTDGEKLRRQIDMIDPDVIIAGNVWELVQHLWPDAQVIYDRVWRVGGRTLIAVAHPASQYPNWLNYYAFAGLLQNSGIAMKALPANTR